MDNRNLKTKMTSGFVWNLLGLVGRQGTTFLVSLVLCRILDVRDFGVIALSMGLVGMVLGLTDAGLVSALIRQKDASKEQWSTAFWLNIFLGVFLVAVLCISGPALGAAFREPQVGILIVVFAPLALVYALSSTQQTYLRKEMRFKELAIASLIAGLVSGFVGIFLAYSGYGVWTLVVQAYLAAVVRGCAIWFISSWRPTLHFEISSLSPLWPYIRRVYPVDMLGIFFSRLDTLVIGRMFGPVSLGYYNRSKSFELLINRFAAESLRTVLFSGFSLISNDKTQAGKLYQRLLDIVAYLSVGLAGFFYITADEIVPILFSDKWIPSIPYLKVMLLAGYVAPVISIQVSILRAVGDGRSYLGGDLIKKLLLIASLVIGFQFGILGFLWARVAVSTLETLVINPIFVQRDVNSKQTTQCWIVLKYGLFGGVVVGIWEMLDWSSGGRVADLVINGGYFVVAYFMGNLFLLSELRQTFSQEFHSLMTRYGPSKSI
ncbi:lipopolysaccharide biosynthesis protein [Akkermansiaceae bacterium]|nr:lipopolysaccharide biosynthesis protein [Akkermansiaceae bacterium]